MSKKGVDLSKLKSSIAFMSNASKVYRAKVKEIREQKEQKELEVQEQSKPSLNLNGSTTPLGNT